MSAARRKCHIGLGSLVMVAHGQETIITTPPTGATLLWTWKTSTLFMRAVGATSIRTCGKFRSQSYSICSATFNRFLTHLICFVWQYLHFVYWCQLSSIDGPLLSTSGNRFEVALQRTQGRLKITSSIFTYQIYDHRIGKVPSVSGLHFHEYISSDQTYVWSVHNI